MTVRERPRLSVYWGAGLWEHQRVDGWGPLSAADRPSVPDSLHDVGNRGCAAHSGSRRRQHDQRAGCDTTQPRGRADAPGPSGRRGRPHRGRPQLCAAQPQPTSRAGETVAWQIQRRSDLRRSLHRRLCLWAALILCSASRALLLECRVPKILLACIHHAKFGGRSWPRQQRLQR